MNSPLISTPPASAISAAITAGRLALCAKSRRGVVIFGSGGGAISALGFNALPPGWTCSGDTICAADCGKLCIHAEAMAINEALSIGAPVRGAEMLHVKLVDGELVPGGGPSCWQCSKQMLAVGLVGMWLYEEPGEWRLYDLPTFHRLTLAACGLRGGLS